MSKYFFLILLSGLLLSSCSSAEEENTEGEKQEEAMRYVPTEVVKKQIYIPVQTVTGTLFPQAESVITAEVLGSVQQLPVSEGDRVRRGDLIASISRHNTSLLVDITTAKNAVANAKKSLTLMEAQVSESEKTARLTMQQAAENLKSAKKTHASTEVSTKSQITIAKANTELARIALQNAEAQQEELVQNLENQQADIFQNIEDTFQSGFITYRSLLHDIDEFMGFTPESRVQNDGFEVYLGFRNPQTKIDADHALRLLWTNFKNQEADFTANPSGMTTDVFQTLSSDIAETLFLVDTMLKQSLASGGFTQSQLDSFRATVSTARSSVQNVQALVTEGDQIQADFLLSKDQQIRALNTATEQAEQQLLQAELGITQTESGGEVSTTGTDTQVLQAKNALESATHQFSLLEEQNKTALHQAKVAVQNAELSLDQAQVQENKFFVKAPVSGVVTIQHAEAGDTVTAGSPLVTIAILDTLVFRGDVSAQEALSLKKGMKASIDIGDEKTYTGKITKIFPVANSITRRVPLEISFPNPGNTVPANIFATASIALRTVTSTFQIPQKSLISQDPPAVFIVGIGESQGEEVFMLERRELILGEYRENFVEVTDGLALGDIFVPEPMLGVSSGDIVTMELPEESGNEDRNTAEEHTGEAGKTGEEIEGEEKRENEKRE